jgi:histidine triad (HIT) family protein
MAYDSTNIFARILRKEIPATIVYEDLHALAFHDIAPQAPVHVLVIPKGEYTSFDDFAAKAPGEEIAGFFHSVQRVAAQMGLPEDGYRLISNHGADAGQLVPHFHVHLLGGEPLGALVSRAA